MVVSDFSSLDNSAEESNGEMLISEEEEEEEEASGYSVQVSKKQKLAIKRAERAEKLQSALKNAALGTGSDNKPLTRSTNAVNTRGLRVRQYPNNHEGPWLVFIRKVSLPLKSLEISSHIFATYPSCKLVTSVNEDKLRVVFGDRTEANMLPYDAKLSTIHRVYIPEISVETIGCISFSAAIQVKI